MGSNIVNVNSGCVFMGDVIRITGFGELHLMEITIGRGERNKLGNIHILI